MLVVVGGGAKIFMSQNRCKYEISKCICPECGKQFPIPRIKGNRREKGHVKNLWCPFCQKTVKMVEIREKDFYTTIDGKIIY